MAQWRACGYTHCRRANYFKFIFGGIIMLHIAENLKSLRKSKDWTQEDIAERLNVSPQSVSKWERGDTYPDITLLPTLANLHKVSIDALIGMDKINDAEARIAIFDAGHSQMRNGDKPAAEKTFSDALKNFPGDESLMLDLALVLAQESDAAKLAQSADLCKRVLAGNPTEKVRHTARATLCFIYYKQGKAEKAINCAKNLPHVRESREEVLQTLGKEPPENDINAYLRFIMLGHEDDQDKIRIDFHENMIHMYVEHDLLGKIKVLRSEVSENKDVPDYNRLPTVRIIDNTMLSPGRVRVSYCADFLLNEDFADPKKATQAVMEALEKIAKR